MPPTTPPLRGARNHWHVHHCRPSRILPSAHDAGSSKPGTVWLQPRKGDEPKPRPRAASDPIPAGSRRSALGRTEHPLRRVAISRRRLTSNRTTACSPTTPCIWRRAVEMESVCWRHLTLNSAPFLTSPSFAPTTSSDRALIPCARTELEQGGHGTRTAVYTQGEDASAPSA